jgi:glycosyltransferase involved in cell wall biosynthesis
MQSKEIILFYKNLCSVGGAEVLLSRHYKFLKRIGFKVKVICFGHEKSIELDIKQSDIHNINSKSTFISFIKLVIALNKIKPIYSFCHSGYLDFSAAAIFTNSRFSTFVHHPTTMSFNETDKLSFLYFNKYKKFSKNDDMFKKLLALKKNYSFLKKVYINVRAPISQHLLKKSEKIFVLSEYAAKEKEFIFGIKTIALSGAISSNKLVNYEQPKQLNKKQVLNFVTLSRLDKNKRIDIIIESMKILKSKGYSFNLLIAGTGPEMRNLNCLVDKYKLNNEVKFLGYVPDDEIKNLYQEMDMFITIDWADFRITTYETLIYNRKIIVSSDTEKDLFLENSGYLKYSHPKAEDLSNNIINHLNSKILCTSKDLESYLENFTWDSYFNSINKHAQVSI